MNTWIQAVRMYNRDHPATRWIMPVKGGEPYKEVKALQAAEKPEAKRAKALTGLRKVEAETKARNEARAAEAKARNEARKAAGVSNKAAAPAVPESRAKMILDEFARYKKIIEEGNMKTTGTQDRLVNARDFILTRRKQLKEPKNKSLYEELKDSELMTYKIPKKIMDMKLSPAENELEEKPAKIEAPKKAEAQAKMPETEPKNKYSFLKKMPHIPSPNLAQLLGVELTAAQKKQVAATEKLFDSPIMPKYLFVGNDMDCGMAADHMTASVIVGMLVENVAKKYNLEKQSLDHLTFFYQTDRAHTPDAKVRAAITNALKKMGKEVPEAFTVDQ